LSQEKKKEKIPRNLLFSIFLRSFLLQMQMNYSRMQGLGFGLGILPIVQVLKLRTEALADFLRRHTGFFNAHPYMSTYAMGSIARLEAEGKDGELILELKSKLMGLLGLLGDQIFWSRLKPLLATSAILALFFLKWPPIGGFRTTTIWILSLLFILYNLAQFYVRWKGLTWGYRSGEAVLKIITKIHLLKYRLHLSLIAALVTGFLLVKVDKVMEQDLVYFASFSSALICLRLKSPLWLTLLFAFAVALSASFIKGLRIG
jgi:mannose/fructose/N-acetylgalactosamine-specific phosphotransferase system component IID